MGGEGGAQKALERQQIAEIRVASVLLAGLQAFMSRNGELRVGID